MDEKLRTGIKDLYGTLTDEQKVKAAVCRTGKDLTAFADREGVELPDELLDAVAGGNAEDNYVFFFTNVLWPEAMKRGISPTDFRSLDALEQELLKNYSL